MPWSSSTRRPSVRRSSAVWLTPSGRGAEDATAGFRGITFRLEAEDVEATVKKAVAAGAELVSKVTEDGAGVLGKVKDPFGIVWGITSVTNKGAEDEA